MSVIILSAAEICRRSRATGCCCRSSFRHRASIVRSCSFVCSSSCPTGGRERHVLLLQGLCGQADGLRAGRAHLGQLLVEGGELLVKFTSH